MTSRITKADEFYEELLYGSGSFTIDELAVGGSVDVTLLSDEHVDSTRWEEIRTAVWLEGGVHYAYDYRRGLTEMQENDDEFYPSDIYVVEPVERTVTDYVRVSA